MAMTEAMRIYELADVLGMNLCYDSAKDVIGGERSFDAEIGGMDVAIKQQVVSSLITDNAYMILVKVIGNVALFVTVSRASGKDIICLHILNAAKLDSVTGWLEKHKPKSIHEALKALQPGIVRSYIKVGKDKWDQLKSLPFNILA